MGESQSTFFHLIVPSLRFVGSLADAEVLADVGLLRRSYNSQGNLLFYVSPAGLKYYESRRQSSPPVESIENELRAFLTAPELSEPHRSACSKWEQAVGLLWAADSAQTLTMIGHLCREALQEFTSTLAKEHNVDVSSFQVTQTVARLKVNAVRKFGVHVITRV
jgi:hypothetical protein